VRAHPLKGFDHSIFGPSQNDDMGIGDNDPHPALGDRDHFAHSGEHPKSHKKSRSIFPWSAFSCHKAMGQKVARSQAPAPASWRKRAGVIEEWPKAMKSVKVQVRTSLRDIMDSAIHNASGLGSTRARSIHP
jgi:hypothetical protein